MKFNIVHSTKRAYIHTNGATLSGPSWGFLLLQIEDKRDSITMKSNSVYMFISNQRNTISGHTMRIMHFYWTSEHEYCRTKLNSVNIIQHGGCCNKLLSSDYIENSCKQREWFVRMLRRYDDIASQATIIHFLRAKHFQPRMPILIRFSFLVFLSFGCGTLMPLR